jgi:hypothetical protein
LAIISPAIMAHDSQHAQGTASPITTSAVISPLVNDKKRQRTKKRTRKAFRDPQLSFSDPADMSPTEGEPFNEDEMYDAQMSGSDHGVETIRKPSKKRMTKETSREHVIEPMVWTLLYSNISHYLTLL